MTILDKHIDEIRKLCVEHKVKRIYAFGSVLTDAFKPDSDVDLVVDFEPMDVASYVDNYYDLKYSLQDMLHRKVDLLEEQAIKNPYFKQNINQHKNLVYGY